MNETPDIEMFPRTGAPYSLNEVLFIMDRIRSNTTIEQIADLVHREPYSLVFKFLEYRPVKSDGSLELTKSVKTSKESLSYVEPKGKMYSIDEDQIDLVAAQIDSNIKKFQDSNQNLIRRTKEEWENAG